MTAPPSRRPRLLDLFCKAGGAGAGYQRAGFDVVGVDIEPQPRYPYAFVQADALGFLAEHGHEYDAIHASPPCQRYSNAQRIQGREHPDLIAATRAVLPPGIPYVIENVEGAAAELRDPALLCGAMFGLRTYRHRLFETGGFTVPPREHPAHTAPVAKMGRPVQPGQYIHIVGNFSGAQLARQVMDMPWATRHDLREAIPPAYTQHIGTALLAALTPARSSPAMSARVLRIVPDDPDPTDEPSAYALPADLDAERAVLGAAMLSATTLAEMRTLIDGSDFYRPAHETIWQAACALADAGRRVDALTLAAALGPDLTRVGGAPYLHTCMGSVPTAANGPYHAEILRQKAYARRLIQAGARLVQMGRTEIESDLKAAARAELQALIEADTRGWADPIPLRSVRAVPPFPLASLPSWVHAKVAAVAHETQTPVDLAGTLALACLATAAAGKVRVNVRPEHGWSEPTNLYLVCALPPGSRKSPVFNAMTKPILAAEKHLQEVMAPRIIELRVDRKAADDYAARMADQLAKASLSERDGARHEAHAAALAAEAIKVPAEPRLFADDATPEQLTSMLADQDGAMAILSAESEIFDVIAGRYSGNPNMNVFLKGHAGDAMRVDRKARAAEKVDDPALTLGVCTQPAALAALAAIPGAAGRGLLARFLFSIPESNIGRRDTKPAPADPQAHTDYAMNLSSLILSLWDQAEPAALTLTPAASRLLDAVAEDVETGMDEGGALAHLNDWGSKAVGTMMRIAALLHLAEHFRNGYERPIELETVAAAHALIEYYTAHTLAAFDTMTTDPTTDRARHVLEWIERTGTLRFTGRDSFRAVARSKFPKMTDLDPVLALLEQHGYLRRLPAPPTLARGRPTAPTYEVHPTLST